jgi:hypothetical protein
VVPTANFQRNLHQHTRSVHLPLSAILTISFINTALSKYNFVGIALLFYL